MADTPLSRLDVSSRLTLGIARKEAQNLSHEFIGVEHLLLGLAKVGDEYVNKIFNHIGLSPEDLEKIVKEKLHPSPSMVTMGQMPFTPRAMESMRLALEKAVGLGSNSIEPYHMLLGAIYQDGSPAQKLFAEKGMTPENVRDYLINCLIPPGRPDHCCL